MLIDILERNLTNNSFWNEVNKIHNQMSSAGRRDFPPVNYYLQGDEAHVYVMLPGFHPENTEISVKGKRLEISGKNENAFAEYKSWNNESFSGEFKRVVELPFMVEADKVTASFESGILKIVLPKAEIEKPKKIKIS